MTAKYEAMINIGFPLSTTFEIVEKALISIKVKINQINTENGTVVAKKGASFKSWGEKIFVTVKPNQDECIIQIKSQSALWTTTQDWGTNQRNVEELVSAILALKDTYPSENKNAFSTSSKKHHTENNREHPEDESAESVEGDDPFKVLNIRPSASKNEITEAYRAMAKMYHPDRITGLGPEFIKLAEERMKIINGAYEQIIRSIK